MLITTLQYIQSLPGNNASAHPRNTTVYTVSPGEQRFRASTQHYSIYTLPGNSASAHPRNTTVYIVSPGERFFRATALSPQGLGSPPNSPPPPRLRETPYTTTSLPCSIMDRLLLSYPERAGIPNYEEGANLLGLVRRPRYLPLELQPRSPECSPHYPLSIQRYTPDSSGLGVSPSRTLLLSLLGLPDRPTSFRTIHRQSLAHLHTRYLTQSHTVKSHNNTLNCNYSRNYFNSRNKLV